MSGKRRTATSVKWTKPTLALFRKVKPGALVRTQWLDIVEDPTGNPEKSSVVRRNTYGLFHSLRKGPEGYILTLTFTRDPDGSEQSGWICFPLSVIKELEVIKSEV